MIAVPILKLFSIVTCYTTIIVDLLLLVYTFWRNRIHFLLYQKVKVAVSILIGATG